MFGLPRRRSRAALALRTAGGGAVGAMAMSGMRMVTTHLGLLEDVPPEEVSREKLPQLFSSLPPDARKVAVELFHWGFGAFAGAVFALLPRRAVTFRAAGPLYGVLIWAIFEAGISPLLGLGAHTRRISDHASLLVDHVLYGEVVSRSGA